MSNRTLVVFAPMLVACGHPPPAPAPQAAADHVANDARKSSDAPADPPPRAPVEGLADVVDLSVGEEHACEERPQGHREPDVLEEECDAQHEHEREGGEDLAQAGAGDVPEDGPREEVTDRERGDDRQRGECEPRP